MYLEDDGATDRSQSGGSVAGGSDGGKGGSVRGSIPTTVSGQRGAFSPAVRSLGELADRAPVIVIDTREQEPLALGICRAALLRISCARNVTVTEAIPVTIGGGF